MAEAAQAEAALAEAALTEAEAAALAVGVEEGAAASFGLAGARPNPARGPAVVAFALGAPARVRRAAYDVLGWEVALLHDGPLAAGAYALSLPAGALPPGVYVLRAAVRTSGGERVLTRRLTVAR